MTEFEKLVHVLSDAGVEFVLVGGLAVVAHGYVRTTADLDLCYARSPANLKRIVSALSPAKPRLRGAPPGLPFFFDETTLRNGLNFTLESDYGEIDLLGELAGLGGYGDISLEAQTIRLYERDVLILSLDQLLRSKAAAGRAKDLVDIEALKKLAAPKA